MFYFANCNFCADWRVCEVNFASRTKICKIARWPISSSGFLHHVLYGSVHSCEERGVLYYPHLL